MLSKDCSTVVRTRMVMNINRIGWMITDRGERMLMLLDRIGRLGRRGNGWDHKVMDRIVMMVMLYDRISTSLSTVYSCHSLPSTSQSSVVPSVCFILSLRLKRKTRTLEFIWSNPWFNELRADCN